MSKKIILEVSQEERNRILEMHRLLITEADVTHSGVLREPVFEDVIPKEMRDCPKVKYSFCKIDLYLDTLSFYLLYKFTLYLECFL